MLSARLPTCVRHILLKTGHQYPKNVTTSIKFNMRKFSWYQPSKDSNVCNHTQTFPSCFHTFSKLNLQLKEDGDENDILLWDDEFRARKFMNIKIEKKSGLFSKTLGFLAQMRYANLFLVKEGSDFSTEGKILTLEDLTQPDVLATTGYVNDKRPSIVIENRSHSADEWRQLVQKLQDITGYSLNISTICLFEFVMLNRKCVMFDFRLDVHEQRKSPTVNSFLDFLFSSEEMINVCQRSLSLYICFNLSDIDAVLKIYRRAKEHIEIFGLDMMELLVKVLPDTEHVDDVYLYHDIIQHTLITKTSEPRIIMAALKSGDIDTTFKRLGNFLKNVESERLSFIIYEVICEILQMFKYSEDPLIWDRNREVIEGLFSALANSTLHIDQTVAQAIAKWFLLIKNEKWEYAIVKDRDIRNLKCPFTGFNFEEKKLSEEECDYLAYACLNKINEQRHVKLQGTDIDGQLVGTHPNEFNAFIHMMYENGPYDIVVDGLNTLMNFQETFRDNKVLRMDHFLRRKVEAAEKNFGYKPNVLIVFRMHVKKKIPKNAFHDYAHVWFASDHSTDDPFFMYAAAISGGNCKFLTLDLLRNFKANFETKLNFRAGKLLYKWQQINQDISAQEKIVASPGISPDVSIYRGRNTWHFPFINGKIEKTISPGHWLCLKKGS